MLLILEGGFDFDDEGVLDLREDGLLTLDVINLLELGYGPFLHDFEGKSGFAAGSSDHSLLHPPKGASSESSPYFKIPDCEWPIEEFVLLHEVVCGFM